MKNFDINTAFIKQHWKELLHEKDPYLKESFIILHHAVQFISISGKYLLPARGDDSHTSLKWINDKELFAGEWLNGIKPYRVCVSPKDFALEIYNYDWVQQYKICLLNKTKKDIYANLKSRLAEMGFNVSGMSINMHYDMPYHPVDHGSKYELSDSVDVNEVAKYYSNSNLLFKQIAANVLNAGEVRCWPHHFDIAMSVPIETDSSGDAVKSITIGFSPPDTCFMEPYFYISCWSKQTVKSPPPDLGLGIWNTNDWTGAALLSSELTSKTGINNQVELLTLFFKSNISKVKRYII